MSIPTNPGSPGVAKYFPKGDDVVGIMSNGVLLDSHEATWAYDSCNGHSDKNHQYHYHIPTQCLLNALGVPTPNDVEWWIEDANATKQVRSYTEMSEQWPKQSTTAVGTPAAPTVVGFARDGFPIFAPYDEKGILQRGSNYGGDLDECNGKADSNGRYGYYFTVDPPFAPPCLRGDIDSGYFTYLSTNKACPANGIVNTIIDATGNGSIEPDSEPSSGNIVRVVGVSTLVEVAIMAAATAFF